MAEEILSQQEIDMLIRAAQQPLDEDEEPAPEETTVSNSYDFRRPNKFSKEHMRGLQRVHEQFCRTYAGLMSAKLRSGMELQLNSIEQLTFGEFVRSLPNPSVLAILNAEPLEGNFIVQFTPEIVFLLHDRLCGGPGRPVSRSRELTDIEMAVLRRQVITTFAQLLGDSWREISELDFGLDHLETNPQFLQTAADRDVVVLLTLSFRLNSMEDMINICIPYRTLEPIMKRLTQHRLFDSLRQPSPETLKKLKEKVRAALLPVEVELGRATVTVQDLLDLEVGDVIPLDRHRHENLDVKIGSLTKFKGTPGKLGSKLGVVITAVCEHEGAPDDE